MKKRVANAVDYVRRFLPRLAGSEVFFVGAALFSLLFMLVGAVDIARRFCETPFDGVFQTLFPLRRMDIGEMPGRDFFYFHGNGIPYLLYPIYWIVSRITGQELLASLLSTYVINILFLYLPVCMVVGSMFGRKWAWVALVVSSYFNEVAFIFGFYNSPLFIGAPMGVRMAPHLLLMAVLTYRYRESSEISVAKVSLAGAILGIAPYFGAEQGVYAIFGACTALLFVGGWRGVILSAICGAVSVCVFIGSQLILFGGVDTLRAMKIISDNQVWVYGVYPNTFFENISSVFLFKKTVAIPSQLTTLVAAGYVLWLMFSSYNKRFKQSYKAGVLAAFFGGCVSWLSNVGYVGNHQSAIFMKILTLALCVVLIDLASKQLSGAEVENKV